MKAKNSQSKEQEAKMAIKTFTETTTTTIEPAPMLTVKQLARKLSVSEHWVYQQVAEKKIPFHKMGWSIRFDPQEIQKWWDEGKII
jgi:excisionase family DNA binding protein